MDIKTDHVVLRPDQKGIKFYADREQAEKVFSLIIRRLSEKGPPYNTAKVPQAEEFLPSNLVRGSKTHALFLFLLCFWMRGGTESNTAALSLKAMYEQEPDVFDPEKYQGSTPEQTVRQVADIAVVLKKFRLGQSIDQNSQGWVYNMRKLARFWSGDVRKLMDDKPKFDALAGRIIGKTKEGDAFINEDNPNGFMFFREKMVAMIAYFLMDSKLVEMFYGPVPVDFHVLRLLVSNQILRAEGLDTEGTIGVDFMKRHPQRLAREVTEGYCRKYKVSPIALCDALWLLSRTLCRANPGNSGYVADDKRKQATKEKKKEARVETIQHPTFDYFESVGIAAESEDVTEIDPSAPAGRKRYRGLKRSAEELSRGPAVLALEQSCGICPLNGTCKYNISSGAYYIGGMLLPERERVHAPKEQGHFLGREAFQRTIYNPIDPSLRFAEIHLEKE